MGSRSALRNGFGLAAVACAVTLPAPAPRSPAFEVASIRENTSASDNASVRALMLRTLLADRFKLVIRRETRDTNVFALILARPDGRLGTQLRPSSVDCAALFAAAKARGTPEEAPPGPGGTSPQPPPSTDSGSLYTAVQEQLGLKLDAQRGPVDLLVIDSVERPIQD